MKNRRPWGLSALTLAALLLLTAMRPGGAAGAQDNGTAEGTATVTFAAFACPPMPEATPRATPDPDDCTDPLPNATLNVGHEVTLAAGEDNAATAEFPVAPGDIRVNHPRAQAVTLDCHGPDGAPVDAEPGALGLFLYTYDERFHPDGLRDGSELACTAFVALAGDLGDNGAVLTIHNRSCPAGYPGPDYYGACHDTPTVDDQFILSGPTARHGSTDRDGNLTLAALPPGPYELVGGLPSDFGEVVAFCARTPTPSVQFPTTTEQIPGSPGSFLTTIELAPGDDITCDVYAIAAALS